MTYRDDREALHHRVAQLEQELTDARREGEEHGRDEAQTRTADLERRLAEMRGEVEKMSAELHALRGDRPRGRLRGAVVGAAAASLLVFGAAVFFISRSGRSPAPAPIVMAPRPPSPPLPIRPQVPERPVAPLPVPAPAPAIARSTTARWTARVVRADGLGIAPGTACTVDATIRTTDTNALVKDLAVQCGAQSLYRSTDRLNGMSQSSNDAREVLGASDDKSTFTLAYSDIGTRTGERSQIDLDTNHRQASVFRDTIPRFRVELSLPTTSTPGSPLSGPEQRLRRAGKVSHVSGAPPVKEGAACVLRAMPNGKGKDCDVEVACGATVLWPSSARASCTYEASRPVGIATEDGPTGVSLEGSTLTVKARAYGAEIALEEP